MDPNNNTKVANKKYLCGECSYKTSDSGNLSRHRRVHTGTKHDCQTCGKSYKAVYDLKEQLLIIVVTAVKCFMKRDIIMVILLGILDTDPTTVLYVRKPLDTNKILKDI